MLIRISYQEKKVHSFGEMMRKVIMHTQVSGMVEKVKNEHGGLCITGLNTYNYIL